MENKMLKALKKLSIKNPQKANYIRSLQYRHKVNKYLNKDGVCYDTNELKEYQAHAKVGRPPKGDIIDDRRPKANDN